MPDVLSYAAIEGYWIAAGGDPSVASTMAAIAFAESSGQADIKQAGQPYDTTGWGLWQITPGNSESQYGSDSQLFDPLNNAKAAVAKYNSQGLGAWTTYTSGAYKRFLASDAPKAPSGSPGTTPGGATATDAGLSVGGVLGGVLGGITGIGGIGSGLSSIGTFVSDALNLFLAFFRPSTYIRIAAGSFGLLFLILGLICLGREAKGS